MAKTKRFRRANCGHCGSAIEVVSGAWLRWAREQAGVSLTEMARRVGHSKAYLSDIERDRRTVTPKIDRAYLSLPRIL